MILLSGRYAGRKAIILRTEATSTTRKYPHCLVAGVDRYPRKVHKNMSKKRIASRIKVKPFVKYVNVNHLIPTRYNIQTELGVDQITQKLDGLNATAAPAKDAKPEETKDALAKPDVRATFRKSVKAHFEDKYKGLDLNDSQTKNTRLKFFFKKLRF